jgi:hypothetical protein
MRRFLIGAAVCALALTLTAAAPAAERHGGYRGPAPRAYYETHGQRFAGGWYYAGRDHHHWSYSRWDPVYRRTQYYDPYLRCYYYWDAVHYAYYPVPVVVTPVVPPPVVVVPPPVPVSPGPVIIR